MLKKSFMAAALALGTTAALASGVTGPTVIPYRTIDSKVMNFNATVTVTPGGYVVATQNLAAPEVISCDKNASSIVETSVILAYTFDMMGQADLSGKKDEAKAMLSTFRSVIDAERFTAEQCQKSAQPASPALYESAVSSINANEARLEKISKAAGLNLAP